MSDTPIVTEKMSAEAAAALESFDMASWLDDAVNAESEITVYRNGTALLELAELADLADEATEKAKNANMAELSIADEFDEAASDAVEAVRKARERLRESGLTFKMRSIGTTARDALLKKLERDERFKAKPATDDEPSVRGRRDHPEFIEFFQKALLERSIITATDPQGRTNRGPWTAEIIEQLDEKLPLNEFGRLLGKVHELHYTQYEIEKMVDLDF